jgi:hypothetical protein
MSFNLSIRAAGDAATGELVKRVNDALRDSPPDDHDTIRQAADVAHARVDGATADDLVDVQISGDTNPASGRRSLTLHVLVTPLRSAPRAPLGEPWTPAASPFNRSPAERRSSASSTDPASVQTTPAQLGASAATVPGVPTPDDLARMDADRDAAVAQVQRDAARVPMPETPSDTAPVAEREPPKKGQR